MPIAYLITLAVYIETEHVAALSTVHLDSLSTVLVEFKCHNLDTKYLRFIP